MIDVGLLVLRLVLGVIFIGHGAQKLFGSFGGPRISVREDARAAGCKACQAHGDPGWTRGVWRRDTADVGLPDASSGAGPHRGVIVAVVTVHLKNGFFVTRGLRV